MRLGFIGTGTMGSAMAACLLDAGYSLTVHDSVRAQSENLVGRGAGWAGGPREVAESSDVVFTSLPGPSEFEQVVLDPADGILAGLRGGGAIIDTTTNYPETIRSVAVECRKSSIDVLDAPVSGRPPNMTMMVGGDDGTLARYREVLESMARHIVYVGAIGTGMTAKLITQYIGYVHFVTVAEGYLTAAKSGIDPKTLAELIPISAARGNLGAFDRILARDFEGAGSLHIIAKDLELACQLSRSLSAPHETGKAAAEVFNEGMRLGLARLPYHAAVQVMEQAAGVELASH